MALMDPMSWSVINVMDGSFIDGSCLTANFQKFPQESFVSLPMANAIGNIEPLAVDPYAENRVYFLIFFAFLVIFIFVFVVVTSIQVQTYISPIFLAACFYPRHDCNSL